MYVHLTCTTFLAQLTVTDRWRAAGQGWSQQFATWTVWVPVLVAIAAGVGLIVAYRYWTARRAVLRRFGHQAGRLGLTRNQRTVLDRLAAASGAKDLTVVLADPEVFDRGARRLMADAALARLTDQQRHQVAVAIEVVRGKLELGQGRPDGLLEAGTGPRLIRGDAAMVVRRGHAAPVEATAASLKGRDLTLELEGDTTLNLGESCLVRFVRGHVQWELGVSVTVALTGLAIVRTIGEPRCVNLRRFTRVPTNRSVFLALFPFSAGPREDLPEFVPGTVTEIAGPGLRIDAPLVADVGERVLVVVKAGDDRTIQGVGRVRRLVGGEDGLPVLAIEMIGLSEAELGELVRETNAAARGAAAATPEAEPVAAAASSGEGEGA